MPEPATTPVHKRWIRKALARATLDVRRMRNVPFGVRWEDDVRYYLRGRPLGVAFDIGAHTGETALMLLETFPGAHVHSFEPLPENFAELEAATAGRPVSSVHAAVSDSSGPVKLTPGPTTFRGSVHSEGPGIEVPATTVDDYVSERGIDRVDLLKVDTEGHEDAVLRGASRLLASGRTEFVLCECEFTHRPDEPHGDFRAIFELLEPHGYRVVSFYTAGVDNLGWLWGDVLLRRVEEPRNPVWASRSPYAWRDGAA